MAGRHKHKPNGTPKSKYQKYLDSCGRTKKPLQSTTPSGGKISIRKQKEENRKHGRKAKKGVK